MSKSMSGFDDARQWDTVITSDSGGVNFNAKELWRYRDLLRMFVKKDIITVYKQTILGPLWFIIQPILTTLTFIVVFARMAGIGTDGIPSVLFYLISITLWGYFSDTLNVTSKTFIDNANVFGKVYFPRLILPLSKLVSGLIKFFIQFALFLAFWIYYLAVKPEVRPNAFVLLSPLLLANLALLSLAFGLLITSMTTKYRDLTFLVTFGVQLLMFATPVIYPLSKTSQEHRIFFLLNPLTSIFETFKYGFLGKGIVSIPWLLYSFLFTGTILFLGILSFNKVERRFIDTV